MLGTLTGVIWITGLAVVIVLGVTGTFGKECAPPSCFGHVGVARDMMTYAALWCGFLGVMLQIGSVNQWMRKRFIDGPTGVKAISTKWDATYGPEINDLIEKTITYFSSTAWAVLPCVFFYLILLTLFPDRCIVLEERVVVIFFSNVPAGVLFFWYWATRLEVNKVWDAAKRSTKVDRGQM